MSNDEIHICGAAMGGYGNYDHLQKDEAELQIVVPASMVKGWTLRGMNSPEYRKQLAALLLTGRPYLEPASWIDLPVGRMATFMGIKGFDPRTLLRQDVTLGGERYTVEGVETNPVPDATGRNFGLLVEPKAPDKA